MTQFVVYAILTGLFALWITGVFYRGVPSDSSNRWVWFWIIWIIAMFISYLG